MSRINLAKFIAEHYKGGVTVRDVIRESLTNAIHAGATRISVDLQFEANQGLLGEGERTFLETITITDNGEGFTEENINYFDEICTSHKDSIGGKGVGRLAFLKFANRVEVYSHLKTHSVYFPYTAKFKIDDVIIADPTGEQETKLIISEPKNKVNTKVSILVSSLCDDFRLILFLAKKSGREVTITFTHNSRQPFPDEHIFSAADIDSINTHSFSIDGNLFNCYLFKEDAPRKGIIAMLCANELCVEELQISKRFDTCRYLISITSEYLDQRSDMGRQELKLPKEESETDMISPISREKLIKTVQSECLNLINSAAEGDIESFRRGNIKKIQKYYPFISITDLNGDTSLLDADEIVKTYRVQQAKLEDAVVSALEDGEHVSFDDLSHLASDDLARFIVHRSLVIKSLSNMPKTEIEEVLHDAILKRKSDGSDIRENNVWLIDDKFLSYTNIFSERSLSRIVKSVDDETESKQNRRPDIAAFYSKDTEGLPNKLVIIEFKKQGADIFENQKSLMQCRVYADELVKRIKTIREVFAFAVVEIDEEFYRDMKRSGYKDVFSLSNRVVYNDFDIGENDDVPLHLYVTPASSLIADAKARNKVFEDILRFNVDKTITPTADNVIKILHPEKSSA